MKIKKIIAANIFFLSLLCKLLHAGTADSAAAGADTVVYVDTLSNISGDSIAVDDSARQFSDIAASKDSSPAREYSESENMYRASLPVMRRDYERSDDSSNISPRRPIRKLMSPSAVIAPPVKKDSVIVLPARQPSAGGGGAKFGKKGIVIATGTCVVLCGGIVLYFLTKSNEKKLSDDNTRIANPPDPPQHHYLP
jgi:hypothetical protein